MACPSCGFKVSYAYYQDDWDSDTQWEICAHCAYIFHQHDALDDDEIETCEPAHKED